MNTCVTHHHGCDCREQHFSKIEEENRRLLKRLMELRHSIKGTILNEDGDPLYALIPLRYLESL